MQIVRSMPSRTLRDTVLSGSVQQFAALLDAALTQDRRNWEITGVLNSCTDPVVYIVLSCKNAKRAPELETLANVMTKGFLSPPLVVIKMEDAPVGAVAGLGRTDGALCRECATLGHACARHDGQHLNTIFLSKTLFSKKNQDFFASGHAGHPQAAQAARSAWRYASHVVAPTAFMGAALSLITGGLGIPFLFVCSVAQPKGDRKGMVRGAIGVDTRKAMAPVRVPRFRDAHEPRRCFEV